MKGCYFLILDGTGKTSKTAPWNWPKSWAKILRTTVAAGVGTRRHENGAFGTEIFRRIRLGRSWGTEMAKKRKNWKCSIKSEYITLPYYFYFILIIFIIFITFIIRPNRPHIYPRIYPLFLLLGSTAGIIFTTILLLIL